MRARHELLPLTVPVLLCVAAWAVILLRPAAHARVSPQPRVPAVMTHTTRRPPTPLRPEVQSATAPPTPASAAPTTPETRASETLPPSTPGTSEGVVSFGISGGTFFIGEWGDDWEWSTEGLAWRRNFFYWNRAWQARWQAMRDARRQRSQWVRGVGGAMADDDMTGGSLCEVFSAACRASSRRAASTTAPATTEPVATVRREGHIWHLANATVDATIDPDALCAITVRRDGDTLPALTLDTPASSQCEVAETAAPTQTIERGAVAVALTWRGNGWWQQAIVSLADDGSSPETSITRARTVGATTVTEALNLTAAPLTWTLGGRDLSVASRGALRIELPLR